VHFSSNDFKAG